MNFDKLKVFVTQTIAIVSVNFLAYVYDGQFLFLAIGLDALVLGYDISSLRKRGSD